MERYTDYRSLLEDEYQVRKSARKNFSNNSFARYLGLSSSHYNDILKKRRGLSDKKAIEVLDRLYLSEFEREFFLTSVAAEHSRSVAEKERALEKIQELKTNKVKVLEMETFNMVSRWLDFAILELIRIKDFQMSVEFVAKMFQVEESLVDSTIERLKRLELIKIKDGQWVSHDGILTTKNDIPSEALRNHHSEILELAKEAIREQSVEQRESQSLTFAIDKKDLPEAKEKLRKFMHEFSQTFSNDHDSKNSVYCLTSQLFALIKEGQSPSLDQEN